MIVPEISVSDLKKSLVFYRDVIGFAVDFERPENKFAYLSFHGSEIMIEEDRKRKGNAALWIIEPLDYPRGRGINMSIECPDVQRVFEKIERENYPIRKPMEECWYRNGKTLHGELNFLVQDPDGFLLRFFECLGTKTC